RRELYRGRREAGLHHAALAQGAGGRGKRMNAADLLIKPQRLPPGARCIRVETDPARAGWEYLSFSARRLAAASTWGGDTGDQEAALVLLSGRLTRRVGEEVWELGHRAGPFVGLPWSAYLPPRTAFVIEALEPSEV